MADNLLLHSMAEFSSIIFPILETIQANTIGELTAADQENLKFLHLWLSGRQGKLVVLDANCPDEFIDWIDSVDDLVTYVPQSGIDGIAQMPAVDAWFVHGHPNWFNVYHELAEIYETAKKNQQPMMIFLQNVAWPCARRDWYASPNSIPENFRQPHTWNGDDAADAMKIMNSRENKTYACALKEGGERNGVLTAVEDFVLNHADEFYWALIPSIFGLGVLFSRNHPRASEVARIIAPYHQHPLLINLEKNRMANYLMAYDLKSSEKKMNNQIVVVESDFEQNHFAELESSVMRLLDMLTDELDHPEIWDIFKTSAESESKDSLIDLANYIDKLLDIPQPQKIVKLLTIAHAVCAAYLGNSLFAQKKLEELSIYYPECVLVNGALQRVKYLHARENTARRITTS